MLLEVKQHKAMWIVGFITSLVYVFVFLHAKIYAFMGLQVYYVVISVYGFLLWRGQGTGSREQGIVYSCAGKLMLAAILAATAAIGFAIHYILVRFTDSPVPIGDAVITSIGIVATWMLARRIIEHWYMWIVANAVSIYVYYLQALYPTMGLYLCYTVISVVGLATWWKKGVRHPSVETLRPLRTLKTLKTLPPPKPLAPAAGCVILANGAFPTAPEALKALRQATTLIACDGAVDKLREHGISPDVVIGDMDSIALPPLTSHLSPLFIHDKDQETNDLTKAARYAHRQGIREVLILGATGLREDHTLGNISLLADYSLLFDRVEMLTDYALFTPISRTTTFESFPGQQVSIFSLTPKAKLTTEGLRWPINKRGLAGWWQGTLNESMGSSFTIQIKTKGVFIIYRLLNV